MNDFPIDRCRLQFPALAQEFDGRPAIFFDNPGGSQVPAAVIDAVSGYYRACNANTGGAFETSRRTDEMIERARSAVADFLGAPGPENIIFGPNMTSLTFQLARAFARTIKPRDEIVVTNLDHDANVTPWTDLVSGAFVRVVDVDPSDCTIDMDSLEAALSPRTRLVAVTHASNAVGTIPDVARIVRLAHNAGALVFVDAVQYAPHGPIDVAALDCDFLACSAYKFFGPHVGVLYGKTEQLERLNPYKVRPARDEPPWRWETGTLNHEGIAGVTAAIGYLQGLASLSAPTESNRGSLLRAMASIRDYEKVLCARLLNGLCGIEGIRIYGITEESRLGERLPVVAFTWPRMSASETARLLAKENIFCWSGNYYALRLMERIGLETNGGAVRIGLAHYNTIEEIDRLVQVLSRAG
jgi:cysteine desulfurase family protein (TIGR01976 family)